MSTKVSLSFSQLRNTAAEALHSRPVQVAKAVGANALNGALLGGALGVLFAPATLGLSIPVLTAIGVGAGLSMPVE